MTRRFTCRGFEGTIMEHSGNWWTAIIQVAHVVWVDAGGPTPSAAKARVRRKLDAVERAFRERREPAPDCFAEESTRIARARERGRR